MNERAEVIPTSGTREFLLKDWEAAHRSRESYAGMRLGVLGACLTILGLVVSLSKDAAYPGVVAIWMVLLAVVFASVRILAAVNRAVYVFGLHMASIERELGEVGFATCWAQHVKVDVQDTATKAFLVVLRLVNSGVSLLVAGLAATGSTSTAYTAQRWQLAGVTGLAVLLFVWNEIYIRRELDPRGFVLRIESALRATRENLLSSKHPNTSISFARSEVGAKSPNSPAQADGSAAA